MKTAQLHDVVIIEKATRKIVSFVGKALKGWNGEGNSWDTAELRMQTGKERLNDRYDCVMVEAGKHHEGDVLPCPR